MGLDYTAGPHPRPCQTENISRSGVLFHGMEPVDVQMAMERFDARPAFAAAISDWEVLQVDPRRI